MLENAEFGFPQGVLSKRAGFSQVSASGLSATFVDQVVVGLASQKNNLYALQDNRSLIYDARGGIWNTQGKIGGLNTSLETSPIIRNDYDQTKQQIAYNGSSEPTLVLSAWEDSRGGIRYQIANTSGSIIVPDRELVSSGTFPKVIYQSSNSTFWILYIRASTIRGHSIAESNLYTASAGTNFINSVTSSDLYDVDAMGGTSRFAIAYVDTTNTLNARQYSSAGSQLGLNITTQTASDARLLKIKTLSTLSGSLVGVLYSSGTIARLGVYNFSDFTTFLAPTTVLTALDNQTYNATMAARAGTNIIDLFYDRVSNSTSPDYARTIIGLQVMDTTGSLGYSTTAGSQIFQAGVGLAGDAVHINGKTFIPVVHESITRTAAPLIAPPVQSTWFLLMNSSSVPIVSTKAFYSEAGRIERSHGIPPAHSLVFGGKAFIGAVANRKGAIKTNLSGASFFSPLGLTEMRVNLESTPQSVEVNDAIYFDGGIVSYNDGARMQEVGFHLAPDNISGTSFGSGTGGSAGAGTYGYIFTYESIDNRGNNTLSGRSIPYFLNATSTFSHVLSLYNTHLSNRPTGSIVTRFWRTQANQQVYKLVSERTSTGDGDLIQFSDNVSDATLDDNQLLNTQELSNISPPASHAICNHRNRVFVAVSDNDNDIWYSKPKAVGIPVEWGENQIISCPSEGGRITGLASLSGYLVIFKNDRIYLVEGEGPDAAGNGTGFYPPQLLASADVGCISKHSIVYCPQGVMFQSRRGIMLLDNGLGLSFIGAPVESYTTGTINSAVLSPETNTIRFTLSGSSSPMLTYDYSYGFWNTFSDKGARHSVMLSPVIGKTNHFVLHTDSRNLLNQNITSASCQDYLGTGSSGYSLRFTTGWISLNQISGYKRVQEVAFLGKVKSSSRVQVRVFYDFNDSQEDSSLDTYTIDVSALSSGNTLFRVPMRKQVCSSIKFDVRDIASTGTNPPDGEGIELAGMSIIYRGLEGISKSPWRGNN
ncbi:MAG: hypothetical protein HC875_10500 [Anaerolineales bacterium]|nr:hypothetical protein [Anaerolineales bacterium]